MKQAIATWSTIVGGGFLVFAVGRTIVLARRDRHSPHIEMQARVIDFGRIASNKSTAHYSTITNNGGADLLILGIKPSCGCIAASLASKSLYPGQTVSLELIFTPNKAGEYRQRVIVVTNDPETPAMVLTLNAVVV